MSRLYAGPVDLFDGTGERTRSRSGILLEDDRVAWVGAHARAPREARDAVTLDAAGGFVTPGLFDCHVHLCFDGQADFVHEATEDHAYIAIKAARNAERQLASGVTTVRDLGSVEYIACQVARAVEAGLVRGARVIASGPALTITGGHGHNTLGREVDGPEGMRVAVRQNAKHGARSIKVVATGGVLTPGMTADFTAFTPEEMAAAVDEAHKWGLPIAAHAIGEPGIVRAATAGVDSIEHGSYISTSTARLLAERGTFHVPTFSAIAGIVDHPDEVPDYAVEKGRTVGAAASDSFRRAVRARVRHANGTDAGTPFNPHGDGPMEVVRMADNGLPPARALLAATANAAELCRVADRLGTLEPGKLADLVVYRDSPLDDIRALLRPALVIKDGAIAVDAS